MRNKSTNNNSHLENWQQGEHSTLSPLDRLQLMNEWLKKNKEHVLSATSKNDVAADEEVIGFIDL